MKLLVIGSGMMGSAAAFDMARTPQVNSVTLADSDSKRARDVAARVNRIVGEKKVKAVALEASNERAAACVEHDGFRRQSRFAPAKELWLPPDEIHFARGRTGD